MSDILRFSNANPVRMVITDWKNRNVNNREDKLFTEWSLPGFDSFYQPFLNTDVITIQFDASFDNVHTIRLRNYYTDVIVGAPSSGFSVEIDDRTTYKVEEFESILTGLDGLYYYEIVGDDTDTEEYTARSEPISIRPSHCNTVLIKYSNDDAAFGIDYENSTVEFELRVPAFFSRTADETETELFKDSGGNTSIVSSKGTRVRVLKANTLIPQWLIEKVNLALLHDNVEIDGIAVSADQQWPYEVISDRKLWAEPEAPIILASGSSSYINAHKL